MAVVLVEAAESTHEQMLASATRTAWRMQPTDRDLRAPAAIYADGGGLAQRAEEPQASKQQHAV